MIFIIFRDFSGFFQFNFQFKTFKIINNLTKMCLLFARAPRGCDVALRATWQRHTGSRGAYATHIHYIHIVYILYIIRGIQPSVARKDIQTP